MGARGNDSLKYDRGDGAMMNLPLGIGWETPKPPKPQSRNHPVDRRLNGERIKETLKSLKPS